MESHFFHRSPIKEASEDLEISNAYKNSLQKQG